MSTTPVTLPDTRVHRLHSQAVGDDFELWVATPQPGFAPAPPGPPRALWVLDANLCFGTAVELTRLMHKLYGELPPLLVVGVAYPDGDGLMQGALRTRDFTPSADPRFDAMASSMPRPPRPVEPAMGGATAFLDFLVHEARPRVAEGYEMADTGGILFGSSLAGLFACHTLLTAPGAFGDYLVTSPALWWNDEEIFRRDPPPAPPGTRVFLGVGESEESPNIPSLAPFKMVTNTHRMARRLDGWLPAGAVQARVLPEESHTSVLPVALTRGLRVLSRPRG